MTGLECVWGAARRGDVNHALRLVALLTARPPARLTALPLPTALPTANPLVLHAVGVLCVVSMCVCVCVMCECVCVRVCW